MRTTLNRIYDCNPDCKRGWNALLNYTKDGYKHDNHTRRIKEITSL